MRKRALGKGLDSLIPSKEEEVLAESYRFIPIDAIKPNPYQPRTKINDADIKELAASIKEKGVIEPIVVKRVDDYFILAAGERRLLAARKVGLKEIPALVKDLTDKELLEIGLIENLHRQDLNPIEEACAYEQLNKKFGLTHEEIAQLVGKDRSTVTNLLRLLSLPERLRRYLESGKMSIGHARALLGLDDEFKMLEIGERIVTEELSVRAVEALIKRAMKKQRITPAREKDPNLLILEEELSKLLHTKVVINWLKNKGSLTIFCYELDDFNRIYEILKRGKKEV